MPNTTAIKVQNLTKTYKLYDQPISRLKEALSLSGKKYHKDFFALKEVSFEIKKGETVGIIGKNGAGKSTLLKIITGVLTPTHGHIHVNGKIASLLELGAGFNTSLTGLENVYLNGTIMGYTKHQIEAKVDEIIAFADIGEHIHQPVKTYSSGMFARLAFAVAINVDPDVLVIDEALSVGDFAFQYKCFQKFKDFQHAGKTILFVSHSTQQIIQHCNKAILIHDGRMLRYSDDVKATTMEYEILIRSHEAPKLKQPIISTTHQNFATDFDTTPNKASGEKRFGSHEAILRHIILSKQIDAKVSDPQFVAGEKVYLRFIVLSTRDFASVVLGTSIKNNNGTLLWGDNTVDTPIALKQGLNFFTMNFFLNVVAGEYVLDCGMADISVTPRIELDQRWPVQLVKIVSDHRTTQGIVFAPATITIGR